MNHYNKGTQITVTQYATIHSITRQAVLKRIATGKPLAGALGYIKVGSTWIISVEADKKYFL